MDEFDDKEIAKLLRLKRHEQPPPGYFEDFLHEFHRRQRDELLREPLWRICLQRAQDFMMRLNVPALTSYPAAATAVLIVAAFISLRIYQTPAPSPVAEKSRTSITKQVTSDSEWTLMSPVSSAVFNTNSLRNSNETARTHRAPTTTPRYVLDSVPVSYESNFRF